MACRKSGVLLPQAPAHPSVNLLLFLAYEMHGFAGFQKNPDLVQAHSRFVVHFDRQYPAWPIPSPGSSCMRNSPPSRLILHETRLPAGAERFPAYYGVWGLILSFCCSRAGAAGLRSADKPRSEEHTSELQSLTNLVCRLLLE